jgi:hypothetical protein
VFAELKSPCEEVATVPVLETKDRARFLPRALATSGSAAVGAGGGGGGKGGGVALAGVPKHIFMSPNCSG